MLRILLILCLAICSRPLFATENLGKEIRVYSGDGSFHFAEQFWHDGPNSQGIAQTVSFVANDLTAGEQLTSLYYRLYDSTSERFITPWTAEAGGIPKPHPFITVTVGCSSPAIVPSILKSLSSIRLVLSVNKPITSPEPTHFLDVKSLCVTNPEQFLDLSTGSQGCRIKQ